MFCLGIVLYQVITGEHPFIKNGDNQDDVFKRILNQTPEPITNYRSDISLNFEKIIFRLLKKRPSERFRNMKVFRQFLER